MTAGAEVHDAIAARYRRFARLEAPGRSPLYVALAERIADNAAIVAFLAGLPAPKRQPNLLFAAVRYLFGTPASASAFVECIEAHIGELAALLRLRSTQTNEPARCAILLPALAQLPEPLALLEVGASAGLCLLPDRYAYAYPSAHVPASAPVLDPPPAFSCRADAATPIPERNVEVAWRAGLDLHPVDLLDPDEEVGANRIANESPERIPSLDLDALPEPPDPDAFVLAVDGEPAAWTDGHGVWMQWFTPAV